MILYRFVVFVAMLVEYVALFLLKIDLLTMDV